MMYIQWMGDSALMVAARRGETRVVKELVERGADLNLQNKVCRRYMMYMNRMLVCEISIFLYCMYVL